jgi:cytochrome c553
MRTFAVVILASAFLTAGILVAQQTAPLSPWAYGFDTPAGAAAAANPAPAAGARGQAPGAGGRGQAPAGQAAGARGQAPAADTPQLKLEGSTLSFTAAQVRDTYGPADWFPGDHPTMPEIVAKGNRERQIFACSLCHYPNGKGRPENAGVSGLPYSYFVQTMMDFKNDARKSADTRKANTGRMIAFAKAMTDDEIKATAMYFSSMKWTPWIHVVEADTVPKTRIAGGMFLTLEGEQAGKEPIGQRIIEAPEKGEETENLRNPRSGFVAYVPTGSIKKGETLVVSGGSGKTTACAVCHGAKLEGLGPVPGLAGRSPSYIVRQLHDMQTGVRKGVWADLMKPVVTKLTAEDMLNIAAYTASRPAQ